MGLTNQKFSLGTVVMTPGAQSTITYTEAMDLLQRHVSGDWGDLSENDKRENDFSVNKSLRILSSYKLPDDRGKIWIITEADRSATTFLLPEEY